MNDKPCVSCGFMRTCYYCREADKPPIDLEACAKAAYQGAIDVEVKRLGGLFSHPGYEAAGERSQNYWRAVAAAVLKAAGVKT